MDLDGGAGASRAIGRVVRLYLLRLVCGDLRGECHYGRTTERP